MSVLEVLRALIAEGVLAPFWGSWRLARDEVERMQFPTHVREILARRVGDLSAGARRVMGAAAVLGLSFEEDFIARIADGEDVASALAEAREARVVVAEATGTWRIVHETIREALLDRMQEHEVRAVQQRVAEQLDATGHTDTKSVCRRAAAYAAGDWRRAPDRVFATNYEAGLRTFASFDDDRALWFLSVAERAAAGAGIEPDAPFHQTLGDVYVRRGALSKGRTYFERALQRATDPLQRGVLYSRIAWVDYTVGDAESAWRALEQAFASLSEPMPTGRAVELARSALSWRAIRRELKVGAPVAASSEPERQRVEALCAFHYQGVRLAIENDKPARFLAHALWGLDLAERLGPSRALVRSLLVYGFMQVALGRREAGLGRIRQAEAMAESIHDPVVSAYCLQMRSVALGWAGDIDAALDAGSRLLLGRAHWLELSEYCLLCWNQSLMLGLRGQADAAWQWIARGIEKIRHEPHPTEIAGALEHAARATLAALGREAELAEQFAGVSLPPPGTPGRGAHHRFAFGARVRAFTETAAFGPELEALVREARSTVRDPKRAHLAMAEFYVNLAHARVHQCLRLDASERRDALEQLALSLREVRAVARIPLFTAHLRVLEAYHALLSGSMPQASFLFSCADDLAQRQNCPWVLYMVARGRAHMHKAQGRVHLARTQAEIAAAIAAEHGHAHRLRWIREEFPPADRDGRRGSTIEESPGPATDGDPAVRRPLDAVLQIGQTGSSDLNLTDQVKRILDALVGFIHADAAALFLSPERGGPPAFVAGRDAAGADVPAPQDHPELVHRAFQTGKSVVAGPTAAGDRSQPVHLALAAPLVLRERVIGVVHLAGHRRPLADDELRLLEILASQTAATIELTRALRGHAEELRERKLLEDELRQAQKMEAIGRLAGTIAHDFNNLLAIMTATLDCVQAEHGQVIGSDLADIREACDRAAALTSQLLTFARRQASTPALIHLNAALSSVLPLIRRLLPDNVEVVTQLRSEQDAVFADPNRLEQVLLNLVANARDAMPDGGRLTIGTSDAQAQVAAGEQPEPEPSVLLTIEDTGQGMTPDVLRQAFEPYFSTKEPGKGTGLGLSTVYGIVQQMHGRITVESAPGKGTAFFIHLPRATADADDSSTATRDDARAPAQSTRSYVGRRPETVLLVDDERLILTALERGLAREGYRVLTALSGEEALEIVKRGSPRVDALVTDVLMPGMSGPQLVAQLEALGLKPPHLYVSGFADDAFVAEELLESGRLLIKPFTVRALSERIRRLLEGATVGLEQEA
ncbi:MAG TPA: ATP-binding protein [Polyangiaceae bacterium]|nr:ATP-binding protein [Polyangiaceae bacterium]